jgi:hypothetical protein
MGPRFSIAIGIYVILAVLAGVTLDGKIRLATWLFLALFALKTVFAMLRKRQEE